MLVLIGLLMMMMMRMMKSAEIITAHSGGPVLLSPDVQGVEVGQKPDIRWSHRDLMMRTGSKQECPHRRCQLLENGSLRFTRVHAADSGNYSVEVFNQHGALLRRTEFLLIVTADSSSSSSSSVLVSVLTSCFLLLSLIFIILFIVMRKRNQRTRTTGGPLQENVYVEMHGNRGNKKKDKEEEKPEREEESHYVSCNPAVSMGTPITQQMSVDAEDIYV